MRRAVEHVDRSCDAGIVNDELPVLFGVDIAEEQRAVVVDRGAADGSDLCPVGKRRVGIGRRDDADLGARLGAGDRDLLDAGSDVEVRIGDSEALVERLRFTCRFGVDGIGGSGRFVGSTWRLG